MEHARSLPAPDRSGDTLRWRHTPAQAPGPRPPVVLLHGLASNLTRWSEFVAHTRLARHHDLLRIDLRGHGDSPTRGKLCLECWSADLAALLDAAGAPRAILVGHSLGAQVALHFAATRPQRAHAVVLIDPVFRSALHGKWQRIARYGPLIALGAALVRGLNALGLRRRHIPSLDLEQLDRAAREALHDPATEAAFIKQYSSTWADLKTFRTAHYLQELVELFRPLPAPATYAMPVLVLLSTGATFATLEDTRAIAAGFPRGTVDTIDCHHWPLTERPAEVRGRIERWIELLEGAQHAGPGSAAADPHVEPAAPHG
ncbi:MAG: alpha/beta hydrolase [Burkholderiaceae bacterium]|jgi:pimeloyl-ACP methyl ester carboxylesterase|nr:alpha/beta hydrolase [Burkholderiaceae bacterium]